MNFYKKGVAIAIIRLYSYPMAVPYFNSHSLNSYAQVYDPAVSDSGSVLDDCSQCSGFAFGMKVQQMAANNYLNTSKPDGESFHNPFSDCRFPKVLVRVLYHQKPSPSEPPGLSKENKAQQSDENILYASQSGLRIDHVWSMAVKANSHSINANHSPLESTLKDTAGNGSSGTGRSIPQISSVVDNTSRKAYEQSEKRKASHKAYRESDKYKACLKAYRKTDKYKAYQKNYQRAYEQSGKRKAYENSEKRKAYQKAYQKAYNEVFRNTRDREQAKIAGKRAAAFVIKLNKSRNSDLELIPISPLTSSLSG